MYAVIRTGGKQYKVAPSETLEIGRLSGEAGDKIDFGEVLMVGGDDGITMGGPLVEGAKVQAEIVDHTRGSTILVFKKRRRQNSKRSRGHRQHNTLVRITDIVTGDKGSKPAASAKSE